MAIIVMVMYPHSLLKLLFRESDTGAVPGGSHFIDRDLRWKQRFAAASYSGRRHTIFDGARPCPSTRMQTGR